MNDDDSSAPMRVYGSKISYFTGKLEVYLRYKELPYQFVPMTTRYFNRVVPKATGAAQMPAVELPDGRWLTDTTPIIQHLERVHVDHPVIPADPLQRFMSLLLEDFADEWLWRAALHYRWSHANDRALLSSCIVDELIDLPLPRPILRAMIRRRQLQRYVQKDGVDEATREHVEGSYLHALDLMSAVLESHPYMLGDRPSLADFGLMGPMFRHFSLDPTPAHIMRERAPAVYEWVGRMWNARGSRCTGALVDGIPESWEPILDEVGSTHLEQLSENATAWKLDHVEYDAQIQGVRYRSLPTSCYRVWCLEQLRSAYEALPAEAAAHARALLEKHHCWSPLWRVEKPGSNHDPRGEAPFCPGRRVFD